MKRLELSFLNGYHEAQQFLSNRSRSPDSFMFASHPFQATGFSV